MDGLLLDTEALYIKAWVPVGGMMGIPITAEIARSTVGHDSKSTEEAFQKHFADFTLERARPLISQWLTEYVAEHSIDVKPGARELLEFFKKRGFPLAIGSSNRQQYAEAYLGEVDLLRYFDTIVTADLVGRAKPAPDIFLQAAKNLGLSPEQCLVLEDSPIGAQAAYEAGCLTILVPDLIQPCAMTRERVWQVLPNLLYVPNALFGTGATNG